MEVFNWRIILAPQEEQEGQSEEEQLKQKTKERARKEFLGAVASEGNETCEGIVSGLSPPFEEVTQKQGWYFSSRHSKPQIHSAIVESSSKINVY